MRRGRRRRRHRPGPGGREAGARHRAGPCHPREHADDLHRRGRRRAGPLGRRVTRHPRARAVPAGHRRHPLANGRAARGLRPRRAVHRLLRPVPDQRGHRGPQRQPRRVRAGVPAAVRARGRRRRARPRGDGVLAVARGSRGQHAGPGAVRARRVVAQDRGSPQGPRVRRRHDGALPGRRRRRRRRRRAHAGAADLHARLGPGLPGRHRPPAPGRGPGVRPSGAPGGHRRGHGARPRPRLDRLEGHRERRERRRIAGRGGLGRRGRGGRAGVGGRGDSRGANARVAGA